MDDNLTLETALTPIVDAIPTENQPPTHIPTAPPNINLNNSNAQVDDNSLELDPPLNAHVITQSQSSTNSILADKYVRLYHEDKSYMVLQEYCLPVTSDNPRACKYPYRNCVVRRTKILDTGTLLNDISPTVYKPNLTEKTNLQYTKLDARYVQCFIPNCVERVPKIPKIFHFACHIHNSNHDSEYGFKLVQYKGGNDVLLNQVKNNSEELKLRIKEFPTLNTKLIFPMCSKRCFNILEKLREKSKEKPVSSKKNRKNTKKQTVEHVTPAIWDKDGDENKKSSIRILIDWLTTEGNLSDYFGGVDKNGLTNGNRKETYHNLLATKIRNENGKNTTAINFYICYIQNTYTRK
jgi:hypothetical protein